MSHRLLVMGDNHGDTESLRRVLEDVEGETFDLAVHVGDFTRAWRESRRRDDERRGRELGVEQLRAVEPLLEGIETRTEDGLVWVYGNQDYFGDLAYDLDVGTEITDDGRVAVGGLRFTNSPADAGPNDVLVTHVEKWSLLDHFDGRAHLCGNTHRGRHLGRRLNSSFLQVRDPETGEKRFGGYFVVELDDTSLDVEMRPIGDLERVECDRHGERGVQFQPPSRGCMYCRDRRTLMREMCATAFFGLTADSGESVAEGDLLEYATGLWDDPPTGFRRDFEAYLADLDADRYAPLSRTDEGRIALADRSYAY